jgi:archaeosortase A (PGF-CTERM-specific)
MAFGDLATVYATELLVLAFVSLGLLGLGFWTDGRRSHWLRIAGWVGFASYWPFQAPSFFAHGDPVNGWFTLLGPAALLYVAYHEYKSMEWDEDPDALRWLAGASFIAATSYFVLFELEPVRTRIIYWTGVQSAWALNTFFGMDAVAVQSGLYDGIRATHICLAESYGSPVGALDQTYCGSTAGHPHYAVTIIFACTALQSIMIFVGAVYSTNADVSRKRLAYAAVVPFIYFANLFRNAIIVYGYMVQKWSMFGVPPFEWMHSYVMKAGSLAALVAIALLVFTLLPELHDNVLDLLDLPKRREPGFFDDPPEPPTSEGPPTDVGADA